MQETQEIWVQSWVRKNPWSRKWQPAPIFLPGSFHRQRSLGSMGSQKFGQHWEHTHLCTRYHCATDFGWGVVTMGHFQIKAFNCWYEFRNTLFLVYDSYGKKKCSNARKTIWRVMDPQIAIWRTVAWESYLDAQGT